MTTIPHTPRWDRPGDCVFCDIVDGRAPADYLACLPQTTAFVPLDPVVEDGHVLVVPNTHVRDALTDPGVTAAVMADAVHLARWIGYDQVNILTSVGPAATQSVFHLHIHLVARRAGDRLMLPWGSIREPSAPHWCAPAADLVADLGLVHTPESDGTCAGCGRPHPCPTTVITDRADRGEPT